MTGHFTSYKTRPNHELTTRVVQVGCVGGGRHDKLQYNATISHRAQSRDKILVMCRFVVNRHRSRCNNDLTWAKLLNFCARGRLSIRHRALRVAAFATGADRNHFNPLMV